MDRILLIAMLSIICALGLSACTLRASEIQQPSCIANGSIPNHNYDDGFGGRQFCVNETRINVCDQITNDSIRDSCSLNVAINTNDIVQCASFAYRDGPNAQPQVEFSNNGKRNYYSNADYCYLQIAISTKNVSLCSKMAVDSDFCVQQSS